MELENLERFFFNEFSSSIFMMQSMIRKSFKKNSAQFLISKVGKREKSKKINGSKILSSVTWNNF